MANRFRALRVVHPFPSFLNSALVLGLCLVAGATARSATLLTIGMLGIQMCIGTVNDLVDQQLDAGTKSWKPIPAGVVSVRSTRAIAAIAGVVGLLAPLAVSPIVALMASVMLGCGLVYDLWLKPTAWAWVCFSIAFAVLPVYAWYGSVETLPPLPQFLIPLAALAGPALQLTNGLVDLERDSAGGISTLATRLGRRRALIAVTILLAVIYAVAWMTLATNGSQVSQLAVALSTLLAIGGLVLSASRAVGLRAAGWTVQALAIALLALGWLGAVQSVG
ncbi:MAG TPA: UbiA family prenyltransferase [Candidatus Limnocylindrales bacterium]|jgi:4-hydroxybenzoate polyprenyltransferase